MTYYIDTQELEPRIETCKYILKPECNNVLAFRLACEPLSTGFPRLCKSSNYFTLIKFCCWASTLQIVSEEITRTNFNIAVLNEELSLTTFPLLLTTSS